VEVQDSMVVNLLLLRIQLNHLLERLEMEDSRDGDLDFGVDWLLV